LRDLGGLRVVEAFGGIDEKAEHQRHGGSHHAHCNPYDVFGFGTDVVFRQKALNKLTEKSTAEAEREYKKTDVDWIHSDSVVTSREF
jgi:hypothetical protein